MNYKWKLGINNTSYYHDENGKIHGEVNRISFSDDTYYATLYPANGLGKYIGEASAKKAVEDSIANPITDNLYEHGYSAGDIPSFEAMDITWPADFDLDDTVVVDLSSYEEKPKKKKKK